MILKNLVIFTTLLFYLIIKSKCYYIQTGNHPKITLNNLTFGSCFVGRESDRFDMFKVILENDPQMWMWTGDAAYVDEPTSQFWKSSIDLNSTKARKIFWDSKTNHCKILFHFIVRL